MRGESGIKVSGVNPAAGSPQRCGELPWEIKGERYNGKDNANIYFSKISSKIELP